MKTHIEIWCSKELPVRATGTRTLGSARLVWKGTMSHVPEVGESVALEGEEREVVAVTYDLDSARIPKPFSYLIGPKCSRARLGVRFFPKETE